MTKKCVHFIDSLLLFIILVAFFAGCSSTPVYIADHSPIAIISVAGNESLPWSKSDSDTNSENVDSNSALSSMVNKLIEKDNPELLSGQDRIDNAADTIKSLLITNAGIDVIDHDTLSATSYYKNYQPSFLSSLDAIKPATGFKRLEVIGAKNARLLMQSTGTKGLLIVDFYFEKVNCTGNKWTGKVCAGVTMTVRLLNERGREIVNHKYYATSPEQLAIENRKYDKDALVDLYPATIEAVINQFIVSYIK